jgi:putative tryptophan/tyrosine transport system substrate-binding protein
MRFIELGRREFITLIGSAAAAWPLAVRAQHSGRIPVVGILWHYADAEATAHYRLPLLKGLAELGYIPGKTIILEERYANDVPERFDALAAELVNLKVDVLVAPGGSPFFALHRATSTIPTVFVAVSDPVALHLASSFSKPGGNVSGITQMSFELDAKRLLLLRQAIPTVTHVALLREPTNPAAPFELSQLSSAARELGLSYDVFDVSTGNDIDQVFQKMEEQHFQAVVVFTANLMFSERKRISALGLKHRLAVMAPAKLFVELGTLLSYGPDFPTLWHRAGSFIDKILKGESVGDIPIERPTKFDLCFNLRTAKVLGIEIPPAMLALADEVIE